MKILETKRLFLRQIELDDAEFILKLLNEPSFIQNIGDRGVRTKDTKAAAGLCGLVKRDGLDDVDIGYAFLPQHQSKGYATEAALAVKEYAKNTIGLKRLVAITGPANQGSIRVLEKIGLTFEKMTRLSEDDIELKLYGINFTD